MRTSFEKAAVAIGGRPVTMGLAAKAKRGLAVLVAAIALVVGLMPVAGVAEAAQLPDQVKQGQTQAGERQQVVKNGDIEESATENDPANTTATISYDAGGAELAQDWKDSETVDIGCILEATVAESLPESYLTNPREVFCGIEITTADGASSVYEVGDHIAYTVTGDITVKYLWRNPTLTIHWTSIDGDDLEEPIVLQGDFYGLPVEEVVSSYEVSPSTAFAHDGYISCGYFTHCPMNVYAGSCYAAWALIGDRLDGYGGESMLLDAEEILGDTELYAPMFKCMQETPCITVTPPECGRWTGPVRCCTPGAMSNAPELAIPSESHYTLKPLEGIYEAWWKESVESTEGFIGTFEGGREYCGEARLTSDFGYAFADTDVSVDGGKMIDAHLEEGYFEGIQSCVRITFTVEAQHDPASAVHENETEPTCTEVGGYDDVVRCVACDELISSEHTTISELGHDWSAWVTVKEALGDNSGLEWCTCSRCGDESYREIPELGFGYYVADCDGVHWVKGSETALEFFAIRSMNDGNALSHLTDIMIDDVSIGSSCYETRASESGEEFIVALLPSFLETLELGTHEFATFFDDAWSVGVDFTIAEPKNHGKDNEDVEVGESLDEQAGEGAKEVAKEGVSEGNLRTPQENSLIGQGEGIAGKGISEDEVDTQQEKSRDARGGEGAERTVPENEMRTQQRKSLDRRGEESVEESIPEGERVQQGKNQDGRNGEELESSHMEEVVGQVASQHKTDPTMVTAKSAANVATRSTKSALPQTGDGVRVATFVLSLVALLASSVALVIIRRKEG